MPRTILRLPVVLKRRGKLKRRGFTRGRRPDEKRAIVKLAEGDSIEIFEGGGS